MVMVGGCPTSRKMGGGIVRVGKSPAGICPRGHVQGEYPDPVSAYVTFARTTIIFSVRYSIENFALVDRLGSGVLVSVSFR